jgi:hypothetical protein
VLIGQHARTTRNSPRGGNFLDRGAIVFSGASRNLADTPDRLGDLLGSAR